MRANNKFQLPPKIDQNAHLSNAYLNAGHKSLQGQGGANTAAEEGERGGEGQGGGEGDLQEGVVERRREARVVRVVHFLFVHRYKKLHFLLRSVL